MWRSGLFLTAVAVFCLPFNAQKPVGTGIVAGHVTCADTNTPARLAVVVIRPVPEAKSSATSSELKTVEAQRVQTELDGSFSIPNLAPGTYFVLASLAGYVSPLAALHVSNDDMLEPTTELRKRLMENVPTITVDAHGTSSINLSLERAGAVGGTVLYDDGSPAPGVEVKVQERKDGKWVPVQNLTSDSMSSGGAVTDDRGVYRINGLPPLKEAIVEADLSIQKSTLSFSKVGYGTHGGPSFTFSFYSGNAMRTSEAKPFSLTMGEERTGEDITLPLSKLHKLRGVLVAKTDGHVLNDGMVTLLFADDRSQLGSATIKDGEPSFDFPFVPPGDYVLSVNFAADARFDYVPNPPGSIPPSTVNKTLVHKYGTAELPLHVDSDRTDLTIEVPDRSSPTRDVGH